MIENIPKTITYDSVLLEEECIKYQSWLDEKTEESFKYLQIFDLNFFQLNFYCFQSFYKY